MSDKDRATSEIAVSYMQNRELSWLDFNKRVLDQGADTSVPLLERLGFVSIFWSNLQEFFMIRVGSLTDLMLLKKPIIDSKSGMSVEEQLTAIYQRCHELNPYYEQCFDTLRAQLNKVGIRSLRAKHLSDPQRDFMDDWFYTNIMPFLSPQIVNPRHPFPHLENGALYVVVRLDETASKKGKGEKAARADKSVTVSISLEEGVAGEKPEKSDKGEKSGKGKGKDKSKGGKKGDKGKKASNMGAEGVTLGIIPMPKQCERIIRLPGEGAQFMLLEHAIEMYVDQIFSMYKVKHTNIICVTRNADLDANEGAEEQGEDYREHMKKILKKRTRLMPVRLESEKELSATVKPILLERLGLHESQSFVTKVPLDMSYVYDLAPMLDETTRAQLTYKPFKPQWPASIDPSRRIIDQVAERDLLVSYPYETMDTFVQLLREAVADPSVVSIKITLYRLAKQSHLAEALIAAAEAGKEVTALFELRARFDESNNIEWSQRFDEAGCNVIYGFRDYKVHSKICCITRRTETGFQYITQLGTGNYNEKTARLYTDFSFMTADPEIGRDAALFFRNMTLENLSDEYKTLWIAPLQIKQNLLAGIDEQIALARAGKPASVLFKTNSITDKEIIEKIAEASQAGVQCTLLVRGISCLVPGIPRYTENVCVVSIVGRLLEHSRIYIFGSFSEDFKVYLSSADLMTRNMDKRIEIAWPVEDPELRNKIVGYVGTCMADTAKLRDLLPNRTYTDIGFFAKPERSGGEVRLFDSQGYLIEEAARHLMELDETVASRQIEGPVVGLPGVDGQAIQEDGRDRIRQLAMDEIDLAMLNTEAAQIRAARIAAGLDVDVLNIGSLAGGNDVDAPGAGETDAVADMADMAEKVGMAASEDEKAVAIDVPDTTVGNVTEETIKEETSGSKSSDTATISTISTGISGLPGIEGLYEPEVNPDGTFTIPGLSGDTLVVERAGGPVLAKDARGATAKSGEAAKAAAADDGATLKEVIVQEKSEITAKPSNEPILGSPEGSPFVEAPAEHTSLDIPEEDPKPSFFKRLFGK